MSLYKLLVSFVFGFSGAIIALLIYFVISDDWYVGERIWLRIISHTVVVTIFLGSGYLLWRIK